MILLSKTIIYISDTHKYISLTSKKIAVTFICCYFVDRLRVARPIILKSPVIFCSITPHRCRFLTIHGIEVVSLSLISRSIRSILLITDKLLIVCYITTELCSVGQKLNVYATKLLYYMIAVHNKHMHIYLFSYLENI